MPAPIRKPIVNPFGIIVNSGIRRRVAEGACMKPSSRFPSNCLYIVRQPTADLTIIG